MASPINDKAIPGKVQIIPGTNFALATVLESLSLSDSLEWQDLVEKFGNPSDSKIETLSGKGYLSSINRLIIYLHN
jgi:hypothetical protein